MSISLNPKRLIAAGACLLLLTNLLTMPAVAENAIQSLEAAVGQEQCENSAVGAKSFGHAESDQAVCSEQKLKIAHVAPVGVGVPIQAPEVNKTTGYPEGLEVSPEAETILIAQAASCATCGTVLDPLLLVGSGGKKKNKALLTDSLWGNLILEMAYQRDEQLKKLAKRMNIVNFGTLASIGTIAGGTLSQGVIALGTLNPPAGHEDSYTPGIIGVTLSTATILTFVARMYFNHKMQTDVQDRQIAIKTKVEAVLDHLERSESKCADAQKDLTALIGDRACHEWLQLWQSSHKLALSQPPRITMAPGVAPPAGATAYDVTTVLSGEFWER